MSVWYWTKKRSVTIAINLLRKWLKWYIYWKPKVTIFEITTRYFNPQFFFTTDLRYFPTLAEVTLSSCGRNSTYFISQCSYLIYIESAHAWCIGFENVLYNLIWPFFSNLRGMKPFVTTSGGESFKVFPELPTTQSWHICQPLLSPSFPLLCLLQSLISLVEDAT